MNEIVVYLISGILSGLLAGLFGIGGGIVLIPFLTVFSDLSLQHASGISLFCIIASSLSVSYQKMKDDLVDLGMTTRVETTAIVFGFIGSHLALKLDEQTVQLYFASMVSLIVIIYFRKAFSVEKVDQTKGTSKTNQGVFQIIIAFAGLFSGLLGIGGGALIVPLLNKLANLSIKTATATSAYIMGMTTTGGALGHLQNPDFPFEAVVLSLAGVKLGSFFGTKASVIVPALLLQVSFFLLLIWISIKMWSLVL